MRWQFMRFYLGIAAVLIAAGMVFFYFVHRDFQKDMDARLERYMTRTAGRIREKLAEVKGGPAALEQALRELPPEVFRFPFHRGRRPPPPGERKPAPEERTPSSRRPGPPEFEVRLADPAALPLDGAERARLEEGDVVAFRREGERFVCSAAPEGKAVVMGPFSFRERGPGRSQAPLLVLLAPPLAVLLLIGIAVFLLIRPIERRISSLVEVTRRFGEGELDRRVQVGSTRPVDELEESFNAMAARIERLVDSQRELLRAVSHDLRTPLARIFFALDDAQAANTPEEKDRQLKRIDRSLLDLNGLVEELMEFLRLNAPELPLEVESIDTGDLLQEMRGLVEDLRPGLEVRVEDRAETVHADRRYLSRALRNLVTNAAVHAKASIRLAAEREDAGGFRLVVEDDGPGVPEEDRARIFEPFFRGARHRGDLPDGTHGGSGLGLAVTARIMERLGGRVEVTRGAAGGARFVLHFPPGGYVSLQGFTEKQRTPGA